MNRTLIFTIIALCSLYSCNAPKMKVDLIVTNGNIYILDDSFSSAESFAVKDGKFIAVGTSRDIAAKFVSDKVWDCNGKTVYPGFNDAHCHFYGYGMDLMHYADLAGLTDQESVCQKLQEYKGRIGSGWILGRGWDQNLWPEKSFPDNKRLNELFPDVPVYLVRVDGHAAWCNAKALELAGITAKTNIAGGEVLLKNGQPTGVLIDNAKELVFKQIPSPSLGLKAKALLEAQKNCFAVGLTSVTDCGLSKDVILLIDSLQKSGELQMRINAMMEPSNENLEYFLKSAPYKTDRLQVNTIKLYADGALGSRGAYLLEDYSDDPGNRGLIMDKTSYYEDICQKAYAAGFQVATHCIGDGANRFMLNIYARFLKSKNDRRWRIEHVQVVHPNDMASFGKYSVIPSIQATHATSDMFWADERLGNERLKTAYTYQQLLAQNGWLPNGTDFPIEDISPIKTFFASVCRTNSEGLPVGGFQMENALTREQALRSETIWAAKAGFEEGRKGSIEIGKEADFIVLDTDLMKCNDEAILHTKVLKTVLGGELVFESETDQGKIHQ